MKNYDAFDSLSYGIDSFAPWKFKLVDDIALPEETIVKRYGEAGVEAIKEVINNMYGIGIEPKIRVKKLIFDYPATIIYWYDGTKTVVKCREGEAFDKETGLAMAICKKLIGDKYKSCFRRMIKGAIVKRTEPEKSNMEKLNDVLDNIIEDIDKNAAELHTVETNEITNLLESEDDKSGLLS